MVRHTLKILQQMLQDFQSVSDHFTILRRVKTTFSVHVLDNNLSRIFANIFREASNGIIRIWSSEQGLLKKYFDLCRFKIRISVGIKISEGGGVNGNFR